MSAKKTDTDAYNKPFAKRLRALMNNEHGISPLGRKLTQAELAEALSNAGFPTKRQTISLYINGTTAPDMEKFKAIADYFGVSYDYLLGASDSLNRENIDISAKTGLTDAAIQTLGVLKAEERYSSRSKSALTVLNGLLSTYVYTDSFCYVVWLYADLVNRLEEFNQAKAILKKTKSKDEAIRKLREEHLFYIIPWVEDGFQEENWSDEFMFFQNLIQLEKTLKCQEWTTIELITSLFEGIVPYIPGIYELGWEY
jgi:transcriptional regulator with XRE-family HTH domain